MLGSRIARLSLLLAAAGALCAQCPAQGTRLGTRPLAPNELGGIRIWEDARTGQEPRPGTNDLLIHWDVRFKNETPRELASVTIRLVNEVNGRRIFVGGPVELSHFQNASIPYKGSILPYNKTDFVHVNFAMPKAKWDDAGYMHPEFIGASMFSGKKDLHDAGHLFTFMYNHTGPEVIAQFKKDPSLLSVRTSEGFTVMLMAFGACDPDVIQYVAAHGGSYSDVTSGGSTIMHLAAVGRYPVLELAMKHGGKIDARARSGRTPLIKAIEHGSLPIWKWLLAHGANPNAEAEGFTVMHYAVQEGMLEAVTDLIKAGAKRHDSGGQGPLHYAVFNYVTLDPIHAMGFPIDDVDPKFGITPLMIAAWSGWLEPQVWLLQHGADPNRKDRRGKTAYDYARVGKKYFGNLVQRYRKQM